MTGSNSDTIYINETGISWPSDKGIRYKNTPNAQTVQWLDMENGILLILDGELNRYFLEHFIVWMRTAGLPNFRKLWGRIEVDLDVGTYTVTIVNSKKYLT